MPRLKEGNDLEGTLSYKAPAQQSRCDSADHENTGGRLRCLGVGARSDVAVGLVFMLMIVVTRIVAAAGSTAKIRIVYVERKEIAEWGSRLALHLIPFLLIVE